MRLLICRLADFCFEDAERNNDTDSLFAKDPDQYKNYLDSYRLHVNPENKNNDITILFVPDQNKEVPNYKGLINALRGTESVPVSLYMDMQGGQRTAIYINNALLQLLSRQTQAYHTELAQVVATNYDKKADPFANRSDNFIVDETDRYKIVDLVAGMNAFLQYGHTNSIYYYLKSLAQKDENVDQLVKCMRDIETSINLSRIDDSSDSDWTDHSPDLLSSIKSLKVALENIEKHAEDSGSRLHALFDILIDGIRADYGELLAGDNVDIIAVLEWCLKKDNYQTAALMTEKRLPSYFVRQGILYYAVNKKDLEIAQKYFKFYYLKESTPYLFDDISHYFVRNYLKTLGIFLANKNDKFLKPEKQGCFKERLSSPESLPIHIYTDLSEDACADIVQKYEYICLKRNILAHPENIKQSDIDELKSLFKEFLTKLKEVNKELRTTPKFFLSDNYIRNKNIPKEEKKAIIKDLICLEISYDRPYGLMDDQILEHSDDILKRTNNKNSQSRITSEYVLGPILPALCDLSTKWNDIHTDEGLNYEKILKFLRKKDNKAFATLLIQRNNFTTESPIDYKSLENMKVTTADLPEIDEQYTIKDICDHLCTYEDFVSLSQYLESKEKWEEYVKLKEADLERDRNEKGVDPIIEKNKALLSKLISILCGSTVRLTPNWKALIRYFLPNGSPDDKERLDNLLEVLEITI